MSILVTKHDNFMFAEPYHIDQFGNIYDRDYNDIDTFIDNKGYLAVKLNICDKDKNIRSKIFRVHRLVAYSYIIKNGDDYLFDRNKVFIIDRNKENVGVDNLLWCNSNEINAAMAYIKYGIEGCIKFMTKHNMDIREMNHVLFDTGFQTKLFFRNRYIKKLIEKYGYTETEND